VEASKSALIGIAPAITDVYLLRDSPTSASVAEPDRIAANT
jgi:hypothetical protein